MKATSFLISSASVLVAFASAIPMPLSTPRQSAAAPIEITFKNGDGDSATTFSVTADQLLSTAGNSQLSAGVAATISDPTAACQAFSDNAGTKPLGAPFTSTVAGSFTNLANGGVDSVLADAVPVGAFLCSETADGLKKDETALTTSFASSSTAGSTVRVQIEIEADTIVQNDVPIDGSIFLTHTSSFGVTGLDASLVSATGIDVTKVSCQAFADQKATKIIGTPLTAGVEAIFSADRNAPAIVKALKCSITAGGNLAIV